MEHVAAATREARRETGHLGALAVSWIVWGLVIAVLLVMVGLPLFWLLYQSLLPGRSGDLTLRNYGIVLRQASFLDAIKNSLILSSGAATMGTLFGVPMAWAVARTDMPARAVVRALVLAAFATPPFLGAIAWILLAAPNSGWLNTAIAGLLGTARGPFDIYSLAGATFIVGIYSYTYPFMLTTASLEIVSSDMEDAANGLGAGKLTTLRQITLPLVLPAILSGFILAFLEALSLFGSPALVLIPARTQVITTLLWRLFQFPSHVEQAAAFAVPLLGVTAILLWFQRRLLAGRGYAAIGGKGGARRPVELGPWRWVLLAYCLLIALFSIFLPYLVLLRASFSRAWGRDFALDNLTLHWYQTVLFGQQTTRLAITNSLLYAAGAATLALSLGTLVAYLVRRRLVPGAPLLGFLAMAPFVVPGIVLAIGFFAAYTRPPLRLYGSGAILILAFATRFLPLAYSNSDNLLRGVGDDLELAARNLGSTQLGTLRRITLPLLRRGLLGGWILVFIPAMRELSVAVLLFTAKTKVMSTVIFELTEEGSYEQVATMGVLMLVLIFAIVTVSYRLVGGDFLSSRRAQG